jgi:hypothetical protein
MVSFSIPFAPIIIGLSISGIILKEFSVLIIDIIFILCYIGVILWIKKAKKKDSSYIKVTDDGLFEIKFVSNKKKIILKEREIVKIDYYRINSFYNWLLFIIPPPLTPKEIVIAYIEDGKTKEDEIGCAKFKDIKKLKKYCIDNDIKITINY